MSTLAQLYRWWFLVVIPKKKRTGSIVAFLASFKEIFNIYFVHEIHGIQENLFPFSKELEYFATSLPPRLWATIRKSFIKWQESKWEEWLYSHIAYNRQLKNSSCSNILPMDGLQWIRESTIFLKYPVAQAASCPTSPSTMNICIEIC